MCAYCIENRDAVEPVDGPSQAMFADNITHGRRVLT